MNATLQKPPAETVNDAATPPYPWKMQARMWIAIDAITHKRLPAIGKVFFGILCAALTAYIIHLLLPILNAPVTIAKQSETATAVANRSREILEILLSGLTLIITAVTAVQVYMMRDISHMEMSNKIFDDNQHHRKCMHRAHQQLNNLAGVLDDSTDFDTIYLYRQWESLRAFAFHYEYMGYLVFRDRLNFDIVFDTVAFPNWLINSQEAQEVIAAGKKSAPDFWNGSTHLYLCYELRRKYNKLCSIKAALRIHSAATIKAAKATLNKERFLAQKQDVLPIQMDRSAENILKNLWITQQELQVAIENWKKHYVTMPY